MYQLQTAIFKFAKEFPRELLTINRSWFDLKLPWILRKFGSFCTHRGRISTKKYQSYNKRPSGILKDYWLGIKVKTKRKKNYQMEGLGNTGHSECPFLQWFCTLCNERPWNWLHGERTTKERQHTDKQTSRQLGWIALEAN